MKNYINPGPCKKCGALGFTLEYHNHRCPRLYKLDERLDMEHLCVTCNICRYIWMTDCLDKQNEN